MLFLGAGASKAVGIGDLKKLTENIKVRLIEEGYEDLIQYINEILEKANLNNRYFNEGEIDIEVIFSVLNGLSNPIKALKDLGPYAIYMNELRGNNVPPLAKSLPDENGMNKIRTLAAEVITSLCNNFREQDAIKYYGDLFEFEKRMQADRGLLFSHTVTTNYDLVFERCATKISDIRARTGFRNTNGDRILPINKIMSEDRYQEIEYLKLHGSINWWIRESDKCIVERNEIQPGTSLMGETYNERLMIYPIYEKYVSEDPFFSLYYYFRKLLYLQSIYVVIGYSFRDPSINNAFADALRNKSNHNSNKKNIQGRIDQYFSELGDKVDIVEVSFGDTNLFQKLEEVLVE